MGSISQKKDKIRVFKAFSKARKEGVALEKIREGVQKYVKYGSTWFSNKCWKDEYDTSGHSSYVLDKYIETMDAFESEPKDEPKRVHYELGNWL